MQHRRKLGPKPSGGFRMAAAGWIAVLAVVTGLFAWLAVLSYSVIRPGRPGNESVRSPLKAVTQTGPEHVVFNWSRDACEPRDVPDVAVRAFRDAGGMVHLIGSHYVTRQAVGPSLRRVEHRCEVVMRSSYDSDPAKYDDREWIAAPYTLDGRRVYALVHEEYQGNTHSGRCPTGIYKRCWYNSVTLARSANAGDSFVQSRPPGQRVASVPYRYRPGGRPYGLFNPSNVVYRAADRYFYALIRAQRYRDQPFGTCVIRTKHLGRPESWRAWGGSGFNRRFIDPYRSRRPPSGHVCAPVSTRQIQGMTDSLTFNTYFGKFMLVGVTNVHDPRTGRPVWGIYYSLSDDLVTWTMRKRVRGAELPWTHRCGDSDPILYPSVLDSRSRSRNFETAGRNAWLYFTRLHYSNCNMTLDRDLVRVPIQFNK